MVAVVANKRALRMKMGLREYSRHRGVSLAAVQKAILYERIQRGTDGKIDSEQADRAWEANTNPAYQRTPSLRVSQRVENLLREWHLADHEEQDDFLIMMGLRFAPRDEE
ncbi:MAG: hypothetical protein H7834_15380 [Magnetococcus sp. YQC-9]